MMNAPGMAVRPETVIINPPIPYNGQIPSLKVDSLITIQGTISPNVQRFAINLSTSALPNCDIALHVNPRFEGTFVIVRNTYKQGNWGDEERDGPSFPLMPGTPFNCSILVTNECYKIAFNSVHFCDYAHRVNKDLVSYISISGDVNLANISIKGNKEVSQIGMAAFMPQANSPPPPYSPYSHPGMAPGMPPHPGMAPGMPPHPGMAPGMPPHPGMAPGMAPGIGAMVYPPSPPAVPYSAPFPGGMRVGCMIFISGKVKKSPDKFAVDLLFEGGIAFHFNPRLNGSVVVCNTLEGDNWGPEERTSTFPFKAQENFEIIIMCEQDKFKVAVGGRHLLEYKHRIPYQTVTKFSIHGDISLTHVRVQ
uniref:Galectin n=1 Tax=Ridgeia piscesae TaxID=27915 RepID=A0A075Q367_RIDPI|nr:galectin/galactose-binding lectin [Ridgeia piscesae]